MSYSFTKPSKKEILSLILKVWVFGVLGVLILLILTNIALSNRLFDLRVYEEILALKHHELKKQSASKVLDIENLKEYKNLVDINTINNIKLKNSIRDVLDMVPNEITLKKLKVDTNEIQIDGISTSKYGFNDIFAASLSSVFDEVKTTFDTSTGGGFEFKSIGILNGGIE